MKMPAIGSTDTVRNGTSRDASSSARTGATPATIGSAVVHAPARSAPVMRRPAVTTAMTTMPAMNAAV
ncbi:hypothetical protein GCM10009527_049770 [Actinomadura nitritigenes]